MPAFVSRRLSALALSIFFFYANACEVCVIVDPAYRKQGIAKQLIKTMLPLPLSKQIDTLLFSAPTLASAKWLTQFGFVYNNSEYHMERNSFEPIFVTKHALTFRKATEADIPTLYSIDNLCFSTDEDNMSGRFDNIIDDSNYTVFLAFHNGKAVGKAHLRWQTDDVILSDIAIIPSFQKQGLGSELLAYCINHALSAGKTKLALDVETSNQNALKLYTRNGFKTSNATDFWAIKTDKLRTVFEPR